MNPFVRLGVGTLLSIGLVACSSSSVNKQTMTGTEKPGSPPPMSDSDHPCTDIDDATLRFIGLNPASRRSLEPDPPETSACSFSSSDIDLTVAASSITFEEYRDSTKGISEGLNIGARPARMVRRPGNDGPCELAMKSQGGVVLLTTMISVSAREWGMDQCGGMKEIAKAIEPRLGSR